MNMTLVIDKIDGQHKELFKIFIQLKRNKE
jgi:hemerythrin